MPQTPSSYTTGGGGTIPNRLRQDALYDTDPNTAMINSLMDMGYNPFRPNSFVQAMLGMAPGLQSAWQLSNLGAKAGDIEANGGIGAMFGQFLRGELGNGTAFNTLANARNNMGSYAQQLAQLGTPGQDLSQVPVFADQLDERLNNPDQFAKLFGSLVTPALGSMGRSYQNALSAQTFAGNRARTMAPSFGTQQEPTFFDWIMGKR